VPDNLPEPSPSDLGAPKGDLSTLPLVFGTLAVLCLAVVLTIAALVATDDGTSASTGSGAPTETHVSLKEFSISPETVSLAVGAKLEVDNDGTVVHNLAVTDTDLKTPDLAAGDTAELDLSSLDPGTYEIMCLIPGHAQQGMVASLELGGGGAGGGGGSGEADYAKMTQDMLDTFAAFPADTEGVGNQPLEPTEVRADGTKVFDLTMEKVDWEVSPGKVVQASTYNGMVPGPLIEIGVGDKMELRVKNDLPMATDLHMHGLNVDNSSDGVGPLTQDLIEPGDTFTYSYTADEQAVAMYHPHAHGYQLLPDGMFGVILVGEVRLPLGQTVGLDAIPADLTVSQEIPMVLNDSGVIGYSLNGKSFPATKPYKAKVGDWILVHYYNEGTQIHPMHMHQFDQIVVAKDGFPLDAPYTADTVNVAPGERYSVLVQIDKPGVWVWHCHILPHVESEAGMHGMVTAVIAE
jgi:FtsP/CotA-like multicopper oxidase with cupredoxin domain